MTWHNETIKEMGLLSQMAYQSFGSDLVKNTSYSEFTDDGVVYYLDKTYTVIDHTDTSSDMQALLLKSGNEYVVAFRGTKGVVDILVDGVIGLGNINAQYNDALAFVNKALKIDGVKGHLTLTGHSLGGILTQQVGAALELDGYAFNPYGVDRLLTTMTNTPGLLHAIMNVAIYQIMDAVGLGSPAESWAKDHILNVSYNDFGVLNGDILSNVVTELTSSHVGAYLPIFGANEGLNGHSIAILNVAIEHYNKVLAHFSDKNYQLLTAAYVSTGSFGKTESIFNDLNIYNASGLSFNFLVDDSASEIASAARGDNSVLYALLHMNPFAIEGNLPAYDNLNSNDYSDQFLEDRAQYLYYAIDPEGRYYDLDTGDMTTFYGYDGGKLGTPISYKYILFGDDEDNQMDGGNHEDHLYGMGGNDILDGGKGADYIEGGTNNDTEDEFDGIYGDALYGGIGKDTLIGGAGKDYLSGGEENDVLIGGLLKKNEDGKYEDDDKQDLLEGDGGFDTYIVGNEDIIKDDHNGEGKVEFLGADLSGTKTQVGEDSHLFRDNDGFTYEINEKGDLIVSKDTLEDGTKSITIQDWENGQLGINLASGDIEISISNNVGSIEPIETIEAVESAEMMRFSVELQRELIPGEVLVLNFGHYVTVKHYETVYEEVLYRNYATRDDYSGHWKVDCKILESEYQLRLSIDDIPSDWVIGETYLGNRILTSIDTGESEEVFVGVGKALIFKEGEKEKILEIKWEDDDREEKDHRFDFIAIVDEEKSNYSDDIKITAKNIGRKIIIDDDEDGTRYDPLIIDANKDGFISTTSLENSNTYFDITGDGLRERIGWVEGDDALIVYDKNENGQIDGISEVFGNDGMNGFEELKLVADSNHDGKVDRGDDLFYRLEAWHDYNQDGLVQEGELKSLQEEGVTSIDLNYVTTDIDINGNTLTEASKYTDAKGDKELIADVLLAADVKDTKVDIGDIPNFTIDESTRVLPNIGGSGLVYDAFIKYNIDPAFKALAEKFANDMGSTIGDFDVYMEMWSGYTAYVTELGERYSVENFEMLEADKQVWIVEKFNATDTYSSNIEAYYEKNLNQGKVPDKAFVDNVILAQDYEILSQKTESSFAINSFFKEEFSDTHYNAETGKFIIDDENAFLTNITEYINSDVHTIAEKLYLASVMQMQQSGLNFDVDAIISSVDNDITKALIRDIFKGKDVVFLENEILDDSGVIIGSSEDENIKISGNEHILLGKGDDILQSGEGHNIFYFRKGDGNDVIRDSGGIDTLRLDEGITRDDVIVQLNRNSDLVIALKEDGKTFDELSDKIVMVDWMKAENRIESIIFGDGSDLKFQDVLVQFKATDGVEVLQLSSGNDMIDTKGGDDVIKAAAGNDTLIGGEGNDRLEGGSGNDTYIFRKGDGRDTIVDTSGHDTLQFDSSIAYDDLTAKIQGNDLLIGIKEDGKSFDELSDIITLTNYQDKLSSIESIFLNAYQSVNIQNLLNAPTNQNDTLKLTDANETIDLLDGDDIVYAEAGDDTIIGGKGDDVLEGGGGNDTYIFSRGDGRDTIYDNYSFGYNNSRSNDGGLDSLIFSDGISAEDIITRYDGSDLLIGIKEDGKTFEELSDVVTIKNYTNSDNLIENILLEDGTKIQIDSPKNGTSGNDTLNFADATEELALQGLGGFDFIHGGSGNDNIQGNSGSDDIYGGAGNDTIIGGKEEDLLAGGAGNDTYVYNRGDGNDIILDDNRDGYVVFGTKEIKLDVLMAKLASSDTPYEDGGYDTLQFGSGISKEDISYTIKGDDLIISIEGSGTIMIKNHLLSENKIENILLSDGTAVDLFAATQLSDNLIFDNTDTVIDALGGDDIVATGNGNDVITGGEGDDILKGGAGNDTYIFNRGDGKDTIKDVQGNETLQFGEGITQDDIIVRLIGRDLIVAIKEDGKSFDELSDVVTIDNHTSSSNKLENITFDDGSLLDVASIALGTEDNDNLIFDNTDTVIDALGGDDIVATGNGNDVITGGEGDDILKGGAGNDTYIFNRGDGKDTIKDVQGNETLQFGEGITQDDIIVRLIGRDLIVAIKEDGKSFDELSDVVTIDNHTSSSNKLENITFDDGSLLDVASIALGTEDNDNLIFDNTDTVIDALGGDDIVATGNGNDVITGGAGNDILKGGAGEDIITGGIGNDVLQGGRENDTYIYNRGDGKDTILDASHSYNINGGILEFDKNEITGELVIKISGDNLINTLKSREMSFSKFATNITYAEDHTLNETMIFMKLVDGNLVIAVVQDGTFENWGNAIVLENYNSSNGTMEFSSGVSKGNLTIDFDANNLVINNEMTVCQNSNAGNDTLQFGDGITQNDIVFKLSGNDLILGLKEDQKNIEELSDQIIIKDYLQSGNTIENIKFSDGSSFVFDATPKATEDSDNLVFGNNDININLLGGDDIATSGSGNDTIIGSGGKDIINSGAGHDTLTGGVDSDTLFGGAGNDTYIFNRGDGQDEIYDTSGNDTLKFGDNIIKSDLLFVQDEYKLTVAIKEDGKAFDELSDKIVITDWFKKMNNIENIILADGTQITNTEIATQLLVSEPDILYSNHGAEMTGGKGDDTYVYKKDDFTVIINDQYTNKEIAVNAGNDTLKFEDILSSQVTLGTKGQDLIIKIDANHDTYTELKDYVVIRDWQNETRGVEQIVFGNGEVLTIDKTATYPPLEFDENWIEGHYYIYGSEDNIIDGSDSSETIESGSGDDTVTALAGNDTINGGLGNDTLSGGSGNDTYIFNRGDGHDTISDDSGLDSIKFGSGITRSDIVIVQVGTDLIMALGADDSITLKDWFNEETIEHRVELMVFGNESVAIADIVTATTVNDDDLEYGDENNHINALEGNDIIHIGGGNDTLSGNEGNDTLYGEEGDDIISGDQGNDLLYGADGNDTYLFGRGDGQDTIIENDFVNWSQSGNDTLKFKDGITTDDILLVQSGDDLIVAIKEDGKIFDELNDKIIIKDWSLYDEVNSRDYSRAYYAVENFAFSDGIIWNMSEIIAHIGTNDGEVIHGFNSNDILQGQKGDDVLQGYLGDDIYIFNRGDGKDIIYDFGRKGDNYSYYNAGNNDTLKFGVGITTDDILVSKIEDSDDIVIGLYEEGKDFEDLSDTITLKDWFNPNNMIENIELNDGTIIDLAAYLSADPTEGNDKLIYGNSADVIDALAGDDVIIAQGGDDIIYGNKGDDNLQGGSGNDTLMGGEGNDILNGGIGNDSLEGGLDDDTYMFNRGDGLDTISDNGGYETLIFGIDITRDDLILFQDGNNLIIAIKEDGVNIEDLADKITIINWLNIETRLENITFSDETMLDIESIISMTGTDQDDTISGIELDDMIYGGVGNDILIGALGDDELYGNSGNDTLIGGEGDDILEGGDGNDNYVFNRGDGLDEIYDLSGIDTLQFGEGIMQDDLIAILDDDNLIIMLKEDGKALEELSDGIFLQDWYLSDNRIENIKLSDGTLLTQNDVVALMATEEDDDIKGTNDDDIINALGGDDIIDGGYGNDVLEGGLGDDTLEGGYGDDTYIFERGNGHDIINDAGGTDRLVFGVGITVDDLDVQQNGNNLILAIKEDGVDFEDLIDAIKINNEIESIEFADGQSFTPESLYQYLTDDIMTIIGTDENDTIRGTDGRDEIIGAGGDDIIIAGSGNDLVYGDGDFYIENTENIGNDIIYGGEGNDIIIAGSGNDALIGGMGDDLLQGSYGSDTYFFERGDGQDTIIEYANQDEIDTIRFGEGITIDDINVESLGDDLIITIDNSMYDMMIDDVITIVHGIHQPYVVEKIELNNGEIYDIVEYFNIELLQDYYPHPIVLDINSDGITSIALNESNAYFDYDGDGNREHTAWMEQGDAQLVVDINQDGKINDGSEIFGEFTRLPDGSLAKDGYEALAQYDTNNDRVIDSKDDAFGNLLLWQDNNQNGKTEEGELTNIQLSNVKAINLDRENGITFEQTIENGNIIINETNYTTIDNKLGIIRDVGFACNPFDTITNNDTLSKEYYGDILSGEDGNDTYLVNRGDGALRINDNGEGDDTIRFGEGITAESLIIKWDQSNNGLIIGIKEPGNTTTSIVDLSDKIIIENWFDISGQIENFVFDDGFTLNTNSLYEQLLSMRDEQGITARVLEENGELIGGAYHDLLYGASGEEALSGQGGNDFLKGLDGDDLLNGDDGDDSLEGGLGDDTIYGGYGNDYYIFNRGDGKDLIFDIAGNQDTLMFGVGITADDIVPVVQGDNILIGLKEEGKSFDELSDVITIEFQLIENFTIENIEFYDGTTISLNSILKPEINDITLTLQEDNSINGVINNIDTSLAYSIVTMPLNGTFTINEKGEYIYSPNQNYNGSDTATLKVTNEYGLSDTVTITLNVAPVNDSPEAFDATVEAIEDTLYNGVLPQASDVDSDTLTYSLKTQPTNGTVVVNEDGTYTYTPNENFNGEENFTYEVSDGELVSEATITLNVANVRDDLTIYGNNHRNVLIGDRIDSGSYDTIYGYNGRDTLKGLDGNDTLYGGNGNDTLYGGNGDDILDGGRGSDRMYGGAGDDVVYMDNFWLEYADGGAGNDTLSYAHSNHGVVTSVFGSAFGFFHCFGKGAINFENLEGSQYSDILSGDNGNNAIYGNRGNDTIYGDRGNDILYGEEGRDTLYGGRGEDIFVFDTELSRSNIDKIMDFSSNDDTLYLDNEVFAKLIEEGTLSADNFVSNTSGRAEDSDDYIIYESDTGKLFYDGDGNGSDAAIQIAQFGYGWSWSAPTITHEDIVVI